MERSWAGVCLGLGGRVPTPSPALSLPPGRAGPPRPPGVRGEAIDELLAGPARRTPSSRCCGGQRGQGGLGGPSAGMRTAGRPTSGRPLAEPPPHPPPQPGSQPGEAARWELDRLVRGPRGPAGGGPDNGPLFPVLRPWARASGDPPAPRAPSAPPGTRPLQGAPLPPCHLSFLC